MKIYLTQFDLDRLTKLLNKKSPHDDYDKALVAELSKAEIVDSQSIPSNVITMNSRVKFKDEHGENLDYWIVFPEDADISKNKISILSPIGCSLIGCKTGDTVNLPTPGGQRKLTIEEIVYQPEKAGDFDL